MEDPEHKPLLTTLQKTKNLSKSEAQRKEINTALSAIVRQYKPETMLYDYEIAWISQKSDAQRKKIFLDSLDEKLFYPQGVLIGWYEKVWEWGLKALGSSVFGAAPFALVPIALVAGGAMFDFIPEGSTLVFFPMALMMPSCIYRGAKVVEFLRQKGSRANCFRCKKTEKIDSYPPAKILFPDDSQILGQAIKEILDNPGGNLTPRESDTPSYEGILGKPIDEIKKTETKYSDDDIFFQVRDEILSTPALIPTAKQNVENEKIEIKINSKDEINKEIDEEKCRLHFHDHEALHWYQAFSLGDAFWQTGKFALFFWEIESYTEATRWWRTWFFVPYLLYGIDKEYNRTMTHFMKKNTKNKNKSMRLVEAKEKKILLDWLGKMSDLVAGEGSDELVNALHSPLEDRKDKIKLSMEINNAIIDYGEWKQNTLEIRNRIINTSIFNYIMKKLPNASVGDKNTVLGLVDKFIGKYFAYNVLDVPNKSDINEPLNFAEMTIAYIKMDQALYNTLSQASPAWNEELEEAVYGYLCKSRIPENKTIPGSLSITEDPLTKLFAGLRQIISGKNPHKRNQFLRALEIDKREPYEESLTESALSLLLPIPKQLVLQPLDLSLDSYPQRETQLVQDLESRSAKSTVKPLLEKTGIFFLAPSAILNFICTIWVASTLLHIMGVDVEAHLYGILSVALVDALVGVFKNWEPQQQEFSAMRHVVSQKNDLWFLRGVAHLSCSFVPAVFEALKVVGMVWTQLEKTTDRWLGHLLIIIGIWPDLISHCLYSGVQVNGMINFLASMIPDWAPEWLKTMGKRVSINAALKNAEEIIENLDENSTETLRTIILKRQEELKKVI